MPKLATLGAFVISALTFAQQAAQQPQVRVNYLNVCTPSAEEERELASALARIPTDPRFAQDFEVARGRSSMESAPTSDWVRVRREFPPAVPLIAAQYSFSVDSESAVEVLVFRTREQKDLLQILIEDTVTGAVAPNSVVSMNTPAERIRIERFGKSSLVLARCPQADQSAYHDLFRRASEILREYRSALGVARIVPRELGELGTPQPASAGAATAPKSGSRGKQPKPPR